MTDPVPVKTVPPQQRIYAPVVVLNSRTFLGLESSCKRPLNTVTEKLHMAVFIDASVAVQVTVVVPAGRVDPLGGLQTIVITPGQLSVAVGVGKVTAVEVVGGHATAETAVTFAGQVIVGG